jgi:hypothetical protein
MVVVLEVVVVAVAMVVIVVVVVTVSIRTCPVASTNFAWFRYAFLECYELHNPPLQPSSCTAVVYNRSYGLHGTHRFFLRLDQHIVRTDCSTSTGLTASSIELVYAIVASRSRDLSSIFSSHALSHSCIWLRGWCSMACQLSN